MKKKNLFISIAGATFATIGIATSIAILAAKKKKFINDYLDEKEHEDADFSLKLDEKELLLKKKDKE